MGGLTALNCFVHLVQYFSLHIFPFLFAKQTLYFPVVGCLSSLSLFAALTQAVTYMPCPHLRINNSLHPSLPL